MKSLSSYSRAIVKTVRENIGARGTTTAASGNDGSAQTSKQYNPIASPYVNVGDDTLLVFIYGISEYGGDDILMPHNASRSNRRYFLKLSGD